MKTKEEIKDLADIYIVERLFASGHDYNEDTKGGYIKGYTQCQEDMADKKYTEEDINEMALDYIINTGGLPKTIKEWQNALWKFYELLNKQD